MPKTIRDAYGEALVRFGAENPDVVVLDADVSSSTKSGAFGKAYPDRFFNCGISEYAMIGMAAGMAKMGKIPFVNSFAVFLSTLCLEGARNFMSYSRLPVKLMGAYGGLSDAYDGATHHSLEDIANMRALPGVNVLVASDEMLTNWLVEEAIRRPEPMYIRLSRDAMPDCHPADTRFELGKGAVVREGRDAAIVACGIMVGIALEAAKILSEKGIEVKVIDMFCIKPLDEELLVRTAKECGAIVTAEEHSIIGGLGSAVAEALVKSDARVPVEMVGMKDTHAESGAYTALFKKYALDAASVAAAVEKAIARK